MAEGYRGPVATIRLTTRIPASAERVWAELADLRSHPQWMRDAVRITFLGDRDRGVGTRMTVLTRVGPLRTHDLMMVDEWEEGRAMSVRHLGAVSGRGRFLLLAEPEGTTLEWTESLVFPWWLGGRLGSWLARPVLARVWRGNLARLSVRVTAGVSGP